MTIYGENLRRVSGPEIEPVTLEQAKRHCRVDPDLTDNDDDILDWISAARELAEDYTHRTFCESTWELTLPGFGEAGIFGDGCKISLPMGPLIGLDSIAYRDVNGEFQPVDTADRQRVQVAANAMPPYITPGTGSVYWPQVQWRALDAVVITYRAGYEGAGSPSDASAVPKKVKQAIKMLVGHWYENRESVVAETRIVPADMQFSFERALDSLKVYP